MTSARLLSGIRVVEFGQYIAAPAAAQILCDLGAEVIKVEPLAGDATRSLGPSGDAMFDAYNRGKQSIALDLRRPEGIRIARDLLAVSDVMLHNMRPGAMERLGLGADDLSNLNPGLVQAAISGFGLDPASAKRAGLDIAAQAESGMMSINGDLGGDPTRVGFAVVDVGASMNLAIGILAALVARDRTGKGQTVDVTLLHTAVHLQSAPWAEYLATGVEPTRVGNGQPNLAPGAELVPTKDGHVVLSAYTTHHWKTLCELTDRADLLTDPRFATNVDRLAHREALRAELETMFSSRTTEEAVEWLTDARLVIGAVRSFSQVQNSPDAMAGNIFGHLDGGGTFVTSPIVISDNVKNTSLPCPGLGADTGEVLKLIGRTNDETDQLRALGIVR